MPDGSPDDLVDPRKCFKGTVVRSDQWSLIDNSWLALASGFYGLIFSLLIVVVPVSFSPCGAVIGVPCG